MDVRTEVLDAARRGLDDVVAFDIATLTNPSLGASFDFRDCETMVGLAISHAKDLQLLDVSALPTVMVDHIASLTRNVMRTLIEIKNFKPDDVHNPKETRDNLATTLARHVEQFRQETIPYFGYLQMKRDSDALTATATRLKTIEESGSDVFQNLSNLAEEAKGKESEIDKVLEAARAAAGTIGVERHSTDFQQIAGKHKLASRWWLAATGVLLSAVAFTAYYFISHQLPEGDLHTAATIQRITSKLVLLSSLYFAVVLAARNYRVNRHLAVVNEHRQTSLQTFETFVKSAGDDIQTKNAVLLETTRTIFSPSVSGYLGAEDENPNNRIIEVLKLASNAKS